MSKHDELIAAGWTLENTKYGLIYTHPNYPNEIGVGWHQSAALKFTREPDQWALQRAKMSAMNDRINEFDKRGTL